MREQIAVKHRLTTRIGYAASVAAIIGLTSCAPPITAATVVVQSPLPDGTECYDRARLPFYHVSNTALVVDMQQARSNDANRAIAGFGAALAIAGAVAGGRAGTAMAVVGGVTALIGALNSNVQTDQRYIADVSYSFSALVDCRQAEARQVRADVRARRMRAADGRARLQALHDLLLDDVIVANQVNDALSRRNQTYGLAAADVDTQIANEPNPAERQRRGVEVAQCKQTIQSNQRALSDQKMAINHAAQSITVSSIEPSHLPG